MMEGRMKLERGMKARDAHVGDFVVYWGSSRTRKEYHGIVAEVVDVDVEENRIRVKTPVYNNPNRTFFEWQSANIFEPCLKMSPSDELDLMFEELR